MAVYQIYKKQQLPITLDEAWEFFSSPKNLQKITPEHMGFHILSGADTEMYPGQIIEYTVKPLLGIPMYWMTEIKNVKYKEFFIDEQRFGPYSLWYHKHFFKEIPGGVEVIDQVHYKLPLGFLGTIAHGLFVKRQLENIFDYRFKVLEEKWGKM
jgi:ligand-binding SRPBCC domain-containing protein